ncbi:MAG TPA: serine/threonine-protein kinase [Burkholderiaceae bacterium]|nr:serine/threonine-protein kinase [Burkholderiaceae bacterium]
MSQRIGKYEVIRRIGEGSSSNVYLCRDPFMQTQVAVKVSKPEALRDPRYAHIYRKLFSVEAQLAGKLRHPHIAAILDAVDEDDLKYIVIEYVRGGTLEKYCEPNNLLPLGKVAELMFKCTRALEFAHRLGITHRDIKPANILCVEEAGDVRDVKITDFGTAMDEAQDTTLVAGIGSPAYMSPEQIREGMLSHQTDIYSLGVVMYQLLTGHLPFEAPNNAGMVYQVLHVDAPTPCMHRPELPENFERIVMKAIAKNCAQRYDTWEAFATDLADAARVQPTSRDSEDIAEAERFDLLKRLRFFEAFDDVQLWEVVHFADWRRAPPHQVLFSEGETGSDFLIVAEGQVRVTRRGRLLNILGPGECVGEMTYLARLNEAHETAASSSAHVTRSADVTTTSPCTLMRISTTALSRASSACQLSFNRAFIGLLVERLQLANQRLST